MINVNEIKSRSSKFTVNSSPVYVSDNLTAKMNGVPAISTSCKVNPICAERAKDSTSICSKCFAQKTVGRYAALSKNLENNFALLNSSVLALDMLPIFGNVNFVRFEAFGDLASITQAINYLNIAKVNPYVTFTLWTKNPGYLDEAIKIVGKPENFIAIVSSPKVNEVAAFNYEWIDHIFTVYDKKTIAAKNIDINCGARSCVTCRRCYTRGNKDFYISEMLK